jgi:hypothetical protein
LGSFTAGWRLLVSWHDFASLSRLLENTPMLATIRSAALVGIETYDVFVEVDAAAGLPQWTMVG